ncbi:MAG: hypothetical protein U0840_09245 [Gemmataceae bacterium]
MSLKPRKEETLSGTMKIGIVILVVTVGVWGCARKTDNRVGTNERVRVLETRCQKFEQDYRIVAQARDAARKEAALLREETERLQKELADKAALIQERDQLLAQVKSNGQQIEEMGKLIGLRTSERDDLKAQLVQRSGERDQLQGRMDKFRKGLQHLLAQDEAPAVSVPSGTPAPVAPTLSNLE